MLSFRSLWDGIFLIGHLRRTPLALSPPTCCLNQCFSPFFSTFIIVKHHISLCVWPTSDRHKYPSRTQEQVVANAEYFINRTTGLKLVLKGNQALISMSGRRARARWTSIALYRMRERERVQQSGRVGVEGLGGWSCQCVCGRGKCKWENEKQRQKRNGK